MNQHHITLASMIMSTICVFIMLFVFNLYNFIGNMFGIWTIPIIFFVWLVGVGFGIQTFTRNQAFDNMAFKNNEKSLSILKERYAKGEITKAEFQRMKAELGNKE